MTPEEKVKAYDKIIKKLNKMHHENCETCQACIEELIPELAETENERIRTKLLNLLKELLELGGVAQDTWSMNDCEQFIDWLEKQDGKQSTWSEKDELMLGKCIDAASGYYSPEDKQSMKGWLRTLKDRYTWSPSEEQMKYLAKAITTLGDEGDCKTASILNDLRLELKKLREE